MGDYLEEILDSNDLEMELMAVLDEGDMLSESRYKELFLGDELFDELDEDDSCE